MTNLYKVTEGIVLTDPRRCKPTEETLRIRDALKQCQIGDSFLVRNSKEAKNASIFAHRLGLKASFRKQSDSTYRIFRIQ